MNPWIAAHCRNAVHIQVVVMFVGADKPVAVHIFRFHGRRHDALPLRAEFAFHGMTQVGVNEQDGSIRRLQDEPGLPQPEERGLLPFRLYSFNPLRQGYKTHCTPRQTASSARRPLSSRMYWAS